MIILSHGAGAGAVFVGSAASQYHDHEFQGRQQPSEIRSDIDRDAKPGVTYDPAL